MVGELKGVTVLILDSSLDYQLSDANTNYRV